MFVVPPRVKNQFYMQFLEKVGGPYIRKFFDLLGRFTIRIIKLGMFLVAVDSELRSSQPPLSTGL